MDFNLLIREYRISICMLYANCQINNNNKGTGNARRKPSTNIFTKYSEQAQHDRNSWRVYYEEYLKSSRECAEK